MGKRSSTVTDILDELRRAASSSDRVECATLVEAFGHRGIGAFLFVPAVLELSPVGGVPGVPTLLAALVFVFAVQIVIGRDHMWLPAVAGRRCVSAPRVVKAMDAMGPVAERLDRWFYGRLEPLVRRASNRIAAAVCLLLTLTVPPLEFVPFASSAPMAAIAAFGLALLVRDGVLMLAASALSIVAIMVVGRMVLG